MIQIFEDGKLKWTIEAVGPGISSNDIKILPSSIVKGCTLSPVTFDEIFLEKLKECKTHVEAYEKTEQLHEQYFEKRKYSDYDSFKVSKSNRLKK